MKLRLVSDQQGSALALVIITMVVMFVVITGLIMVSVQENKHAIYQTDQMQAYYLARAGAESMSKEVLGMAPSDMVNFDGTGLTANASGVLSNTGDISVTITNEPSGSSNYRIRSLGTYGGNRETVDIWMYFEDEVAYDLDYAAYSSDNLSKFDGGSGDINFGTIIGDIASGGDIHNSKSFSGEEIPNYPFELDILDMNLSSINLTTELTHRDLASVPNNTDYTIDSSSFVTNMNFGNGNTLYIDTGSEGAADFSRSESDDDFTMSYTSGTGDWMIVYFSGDVETTGDIVVTGENNLMFVVNGSCRISGNNSEFTMPDDIFVKWYVMDDGADGDDLIIESGITGVLNEPEKFEIILYGESSIFDFSNNGIFYGKVYADGGTVEMKNGNTELYGSIYAGKVNLAAQVSIFYRTSNSEVYAVANTQRIDLDHWGE